MSEILGTLFKTLLGLLAIAVVALVVSQAISGNNVSTASGELSTLQNNVTTLYNGQPTATGLTNAVAISAGVVPSNMVNGASILDPWGGAVTIAADATAGYFDVTMAGVPAVACVRLVTGNSAYTQATIGSTTALTPPAAPATVGTDCSGSSNSIVFQFAA